VIAYLRSGSCVFRPPTLGSARASTVSNGCGLRHICGKHYGYTRVLALLLYLFQLELISQQEHAAYPFFSIENFAGPPDDGSISVELWCYGLPKNTVAPKGCSSRLQGHIECDNRSRDYRLWGGFLITVVLGYAICTCPLRSL